MTVLPAKRPDQGAVEEIKRYSWPGNVREVETAMRGLAALCPHETIGAEQIAAELVEIPPAPSGSGRERAGAAGARGGTPYPRLPGRAARWRRRRRPISMIGLLPRWNASDPADIGGDAGESDQGRRHAGAQSQHAAQEDPRPRHSRGARTDVNAAPPPGSLRPEPPAESRRRRAEVSRARRSLAGSPHPARQGGRRWSLAALAFAVGLATFIFLARGAPFVLRPGVGVGLVLANLSAVLLLVACSPGG